MIHLNLVRTKILIIFYIVITLLFVGSNLYSEREVITSYNNNEFLCMLEDKPNNKTLLENKDTSKRPQKLLCIGLSSGILFSYATTNPGNFLSVPANIFLDINIFDIKAPQETISNTDVSLIKFNTLISFNYINEGFKINNGIILADFIQGVISIKTGFPALFNTSQTIIPYFHLGINFSYNLSKEYKSNIDGKRYYLFEMFKDIINLGLTIGIGIDIDLWIGSVTFNIIYDISLTQTIPSSLIEGQKINQGAINALYLTLGYKFILF